MISPDLTLYRVTRHRESAGWIAYLTVHCGNGGAFWNGDLDTGRMHGPLQNFPCVDCGISLPGAARDALAGHAPKGDVRCYDCGRTRHFARMGVSA